MNKIYLLIFVLLLFDSHIYGQALIEKNGAVSYKSSQNIYVKFDNTKGILEGDTLYSRQGKKLRPAVKVKFISSTSAAGEIINKIILAVDDKVIAFVKNEIHPDEIKHEPLADTTHISASNKTKDVTAAAKVNEYNKKPEKEITGRFSVQSYSGLSNYTAFGDFQRWRYNFSLDARNISGSKISFSNYISFSYRTSDWEEIKNNFAGNMRVYDLAVNYQFNKKTNIWLGRHLNSKITNISSIDGVQLETRPANSSFSFGAVAGSRPDFTNMGFNIKLFEFGGYVSRTDTSQNGLMENTLALMEQTNDMKIDRRFIYFQHSNNTFTNLNFFLSSEIDLYKRVKGKGQNDFSLTGLYFSARYSPVRLVSFLLSYDARKNVIYYETFKSFIETLIDNETRQGLRGGITLRPFSRLFLTLNSGYRYSKSDPKPSRNFNGYIAYSQIPLLEITPSVSISKLITSYVNGITASFRLSKDFEFLNSSLSVEYEKVNYDFNYSTDNLDQNIFSLDVFFGIFKKLYINFNYEGTFQNQNTDSRIIMGLTQRL